MVDIMGDICNLIFSQHADEFIILFLCIAFIFPLGFTLAVNASLGNSLKSGIMTYIGLDIFFKTNFIAYDRFEALSNIAFFENTIQLFSLHADCLLIGSRWNAFQASKAILSMTLLSKSIGQYIGSDVKSGEYGAVTKSKSILIPFGFSLVIPIVLHFSFNIFFVEKQEIMAQF